MVVFDRGGTGVSIEGLGDARVWPKAWISGEACTADVGATVAGGQG